MVKVAIACVLAASATAAAQPGVASPAPRCADKPALPALTVRIGDGHFEASSEDVTREGSIPSVEVAVATPVGMLHASATRFSDRINDASNDTLVNVSDTLVSAGLRGRWRIMRHVTLAAGPGVLFVYERNHTRGMSGTTGGLLFDAVASIELMRHDAVSIELFDRIEGVIGGPGVLSGSSLFGLGVSYLR